VKFSRTVLPAAIVATLLLTTACSGGSGPTADAAGNDCLASGSASEGVKLSGKSGEQLELSSEAPVSATEAERSVITEGKGEVLSDGDTFTYASTMFNGKTGEVLDLDDGSGK